MGWGPQKTTLFWGGEARVPRRDEQYDGGWRALPDRLLVTSDPQDLDELLYELHAITWEQFADFLVAGQSHE